jgi:hypothetical protein
MQNELNDKNGERRIRRYACTEPDPTGAYARRKP